MPGTRVRAQFCRSRRACRPADLPLLSVRLRRCAAAHGGVMATLSWLWGSPRARSHPHAMWKGDQYLTPAIPAFPPRGRFSVPLRTPCCCVYVDVGVTLLVAAVAAVVVASKLPRATSLASGWTIVSGLLQVVW